MTVNKLCMMAAIAAVLLTGCQKSDDVVMPSERTAEHYFEPEEADSSETAPVAKAETQPREREEAVEEETEIEVKAVEMPEESIEKASSIEGITIVIDPGHQKRGNSEHEQVYPNSAETKPKVSQGTAGVSTNKPEYMLNLEVAMKLKDALLDKGAIVFMTRETNDVDISNIERAEFANDVNADICIRIHADSSENQSVNGFSLLVPADTYFDDANMVVVSRSIASQINESLLEATGSKSRGIIERSDLTGFNWSRVPVVLIEMGFMSNPEEDILLSTEDYQNAIVEGIIDGIEKYFQE